ncbi:MAG TPA: methyltransferase domain-containing protein [Vicinamibacterales bacterium]|nr:methyltransferase domain-containing protein [Vicinamibacterales bacterium]
MFFKRDNPHTLVVGMTGVKMGDKFLQVGCAHGGRMAAIASKVGLSGRAVIVVPDEGQASQARKGAASAGVLIELEVAPASHLPVDNGVFDLAVVDDTGGLLANARPEDRVATVREVVRALRPGGRVMIIGTSPRGGFGAVFSRAQSGPPFTASGDANKLLEADGFTSVRTLAEREGLVFVEGLKPRT